jgi:hypothetical protein
MSAVSAADILDLVAWEKVREARRAQIIALKQQRRVALGEWMSLLFENRATVLYQIQEMARTERIVDDARLQEEIDVYGALLPGAGELSATLFIEIPDLHRMNQEQVRATVNRFQGLERDTLWLRLGPHVAVPARFPEGQTNEEKMAAVHYLRFHVSEQARALLADAAVPARLVVEHPRYAAESVLSAELRTQLLADLTER